MSEPWRADRAAQSGLPDPYPPVLAEPSMERLAAYGRWVLAMHQPVPPRALTMPECSCGSVLVLCPYRSAATRYLGPPNH